MYLARNQEILQSLAKRKAVIKTSGKDNEPELICKYPTYVEQTVYRHPVPQFPYRTRNMSWILQLETI